MKSLLIELDDDMVERIERVAPGRSRQRSEFIRAAIRRALWELEERDTAAAYARQPDSPHAYIDPDAWSPGARARRRQPKR
jgi:Arc/MetJ-type ribon-helix-helix transcriptional regulator